MGRFDTLRSEPRIFITCRLSSPQASAMLPISLAKVTLTTRRGLEVYLIILAKRKSTTFRAQGRSWADMVRNAAVLMSSAPNTIRRGS